MIPIFKINDVTAESAFGTLTSTRMGKELWIADNRVGDLFNGSVTIYGRWSESEQGWRFTPEMGDTTQQLEAGTSWFAYDGYWGERVALLIASRGRWVPLTWDAPGEHDHCNICWRKLSMDEEIHYWRCEIWVLCASCHQIHEENFSLDFSSHNGPESPNVSLQRTL